MSLKPISRRTFALNATAFGALPFVGGLAGCSSSVPDSMKIGVLVAQTGVFGLRGKDLINGAQLAVDEINAAGLKVDGKIVKLELDTYDDKGEVEASKAGAEKLAADGVVAVIGPLNTPQAAAVVPVLAQKGVANLFTATATDLVGLGNGNALRLLANDDLQGRAMSVYATDNLKLRRIATIIEAGSYGRGLNKAFVGALSKDEGEVVYSKEIDGKDKVTPEMAAAIKEARADLVVLFAREPQLVSLFDSLQKVNYTDVTVLGTNVVRNRNVAALPIPVKAFYCTATAIDASEFPRGKAFLDAFQKKYGATPVWGAHYAYDAVYSLADAARRGKSVASKDLIATLRRIEPMTGVIDSMRFTDSGEQRYPNIGVYKAERAAWRVQLVSAVW